MWPATDGRSPGIAAHISCVGFDIFPCFPAANYPDSKHCILWECVLHTDVEAYRVICNNVKIQHTGYITLWITSTNLKIMPWVPYSLLPSSIMFLVKESQVITYLGKYTFHEHDNFVHIDIPRYNQTYMYYLFLPIHLQVREIFHDSSGIASHQIIASYDNLNNFVIHVVTSIK